MGGVFPLTPLTPPNVATLAKPADSGVGHRAFGVVLAAGSVAQCSFVKRWSVTCVKGDPAFKFVSVFGGRDGGAAQPLVWACRWAPVRVVASRGVGALSRNRFVGTKCPVAERFAGGLFGGAFPSS